MMQYSSESPYSSFRNNEDLYLAASETLSSVKERSSQLASSLKESISSYLHPVNMDVEMENRKITPLDCKTSKKAFDNKFYYGIADGKIYFKPKGLDRDGHRAHWERIPFPGRAVSISADNGRLVAIDEKQKIYSANVDSLQAELDESDENWRSTSCKLHWEENWYQVKGLSSIVNYFKPQGLYGMEMARKVTLSHRSGESCYFDARGVKHYGEATTLYMLNPRGNRIFFADPRLHTHFENEITTPENGEFIAENMDASCSTLFLIQRARDENGQEINQMYTRHVDFDTMGGNALRLPTYDQNSLNPFAQVLPGEDWHLQPSIPLVGNARLTKRIFITQTGDSPSMRNLHVEGTDESGQTGYYVKSLSDDTWAFQVIGQRIKESAFLPSGKGTGIQKATGIDNTFEGRVVIGESEYKANLSHFLNTHSNERGLHTTLDLPLSNGDTISCKLYSRKEVYDEFGFGKARHVWTIEIPENDTLPPEVSRGVQEVLVTEDPGFIEIRGEGFTAVFQRDGISPPTPRLFNSFIRALLLTSIVFLQAIKFVLKAVERVYDRVVAFTPVIEARERLHQALKLREPAHAACVLSRLIQENPSLAPKELVGFLALGKVIPHLKEAMNGANVMFEDTEEGNILFNELTHCPSARKRPSSHTRLKGTDAYGIASPLFGEFLFWKDPEGKLRFQLEAHSTRNLFQVFYHSIDFLKYKLEDKQQGPHGSSLFNDGSPIKI